ncbi:MAG: CDP-diacylglycerol--serine O-phosphatidyltransferase [Elusimicrobia bacterium]|nr:CDP-diacylglycerol--serine O-phosphatidyltransferase [Elusimicrobiota bacterium]MDE2237356.1 CDP-diacylglycerol--serine O-phosphatidyltransferase [Elusimicrobiota bacterium]MDE2426458.1 CDP-diacylglycerol--serine O-phosphatidyltransferase [Elusimicrobiota bacterium]
MDKQTLKRGGRVLAPSLFTVGNMACGFYALLSAYREEFVSAATAIILGMVFDALDGRVARLIHGESTFGVEFDSLSDFLTFGVAPACMMYAFILKDYGAWGYPIAFLYALCGGLRLARFNAAAHDGGGKTHFIGLPIPGGAGFLASFVLLYQIIEEGRPARTWKLLMDQIPLLYGLAPAMTLGVALLMISTIPYPAFKQAHARPRSLKALLALVLVGLLLFIYPQNFIFVVFWSYVLLGPVGVLARLARRWRRGPGAEVQA